MSSATGNLEIQGNFFEHPLAELLIEAASIELSGSLRLSHEAQKVIVYLKKGRVVFAVSNLRRHRLFETLLQTGKISKESLAETPNFTNDLEFGEALIQKNVLTKGQIDEGFSQIIEDILKKGILWETGEWIFSPLARIRENIEFNVEPSNILMDYARHCPAERIAEHFKTGEEAFQTNPAIPQANLSPQEGFIFSRFENQILTVNELQNLSGLPEIEVFRSVYVLWLGGFIKRQNWHPAFSERKLAMISAARLTLKKEDPVPAENKKESPVSLAQPPSTTAETAEESIIPQNVEAALSVENYLEQVETAENHYETFNLPLEASLSEIKTAYFALAKNFHPDKYHQESDSALQRRIQHAFTEIAKAYETLKSPETKQIYDYRLRKNLETGTSAKKASTPQSLNNESQAKEEFDQGFNFLVKEDYEAAIPYLTRAVQLAPNIARYHAYFGKALAADEKQRFKADAEFQTAIRLEPNNSTFRLFLAEFYINYHLFKRAEGELKRLLVMSPNNKEAQNLLDSLANK